MNKKPPFKILDSFELKLAKRQCNKIKDSVEDGQALIVKVKATHGGYVNGNKFFYNIDSMQDAAKTWTKPFNKPVLVHHDDTSDPIGRVIDSEFVPISTNRRNKPKGYVLLTLRVVDGNAIEKILDGRYMTVSVGSYPESSICNICDRDIVKDGMCNHRRGQIYDGQECYWNINIQDYTEVSFVNKPADEYQHGIESSEVSDEQINEDDIIFDKRFDKPEFYLEDSKSKDENEDKKDDKEENLEEDIKDVLNIDNVDSTWTQDDLDMVLWLMDELEKEFEDAKLTTAQRKKLSANVFCGPNRSFPVNDCAHYTAALRLIGRYKGPGDKSRIRSCIERRGKKMSCTSKKDSQEEKMDVKELETKVAALEQQVSDLNTEKETLKTEKETLESQLNDKSEEINGLNDKIIAFQADKHENLVNNLFDLRLKLGKKDVQDLNEDSVSEYKERLSKRTDESLTDSITDLEDEVKKEETKEPTETVEKESKDKTEDQVEVKKEENKDAETETKDLSDILKK